MMTQGVTRYRQTLDRTRLSLRLQQMQADQEPAQDDTQKKLYDLFKQHQYHENVPPSTHRCEFNRTTPKEEKQPESLYSVKKLGLQ